jgi:hypothetical protein
MERVSKPKSIFGIRNFLEKRVVKETLHPIEVVSKIVSHQYKEILDCAIHNYNTIEITGLCTLTVSEKICRNKYVKLLRRTDGLRAFLDYTPSLTNRERYLYECRYTGFKGKLAWLKFHLERYEKLENEQLERDLNPANFEE